MFGWSISASACRSASKRAITCRRVHARLDDLERDPAADRLGLLGHVDDAHAPFADLLRAACRGRSTVPGPSVEAAIVSGRVAASWRGPTPGSCRLIVMRRSSASTSPRKSASSPQACVQEAGTLGRVGLLERPQKDRFGRRVAGHGMVRPDSCFVRDQCDETARQDLAQRICRIIRRVDPRRLACRSRSAARPGRKPSVDRQLPREIPSASAASSTVRPAKNRSLTSSAFAGRRCASSSRASSDGQQLVGVARRRQSATSSRSIALAGRPPCLTRCLRRALSTRIRRIASAAAAKKWPRLFQLLAVSPSDQPQVRLMHQRRRLQRLPRLLLGQLRRRQLPQLVIHQRQELLGGLRDRRASICDRMRVTSDIAPLSLGQNLPAMDQSSVRDAPIPSLRFLRTSAV